MPSGSRRPMAGCDSGGTPPSPRCRRADWRQCRRARSATSGTWTSTTASGPPAHPHVVDHSQRDAQYLLDYGSSYGTGTATHALTLYRHSSGALVFGAGTVQWSWGLDAVHDCSGAPADPRMQQATVNLLRRHGRAAAHAAARTGSRGGVDGHGRPRGRGHVAGERRLGWKSGTRSQSPERRRDSGGRVAAIEVSIDGGATWRPADRPRELVLFRARSRSSARRAFTSARSMTAGTSRRRRPSVCHRYHPGHDGPPVISNVAVARPCSAPGRA